MASTALGTLPSVLSAGAAGDFIYLIHERTVRRAACHPHDRVVPAHIHTASYTPLLVITSTPPRVHTGPPAESSMALRGSPQGTTHTLNDPAGLGNVSHLQRVIQRVAQHALETSPSFKFVEAAAGRVMYERAVPTHVNDFSPELTWRAPTPRDHAPCSVRAAGGRTSLSSSAPQRRAAASCARPLQASVREHDGPLPSLT